MFLHFKVGLSNISGPRFHRCYVKGSKVGGAELFTLLTPGMGHATRTQHNAFPMMLV